MVLKVSLPPAHVRLSARYAAGRRFKLNKRRQPFFRSHKRTDFHHRDVHLQSRSFARWNPALRRSPTPTGLAEIVSDDFPVFQSALLVAGNRLRHRFLQLKLGAHPLKTSSESPKTLPITAPPPADIDGD
jgi:hypothetical protein